ncbi:MAG: J domain-containing protein [Prolixibacteraceae bacterium]
MNNKLLSITAENEQLTKLLEQLHLEFVDLFTRHKDMVENESDILTSLYLEKLGHLQLQLLQKQTEAARLKMRMKLIQAAINRDEHPNLQAIDNLVNSQMQIYYAQIEVQANALNEAKNVLSHLISKEDTIKLKELFRLLCKRLHPDLNPTQTEDEKDLFIKVKAAYDLQRLNDLQTILLFLKNSKKEKLTLISLDDKAERIKHLEKTIVNLKDKINQLIQAFPFNTKELIFDEEYISHQQEEIKIHIKTCEEEIAKYINIISLMSNE